MVYAVIDTSRFPYAGEMPDEDDRIFYEVCLSKEDSFLVTGNLKHFPKEPQVITAAEMMESKHPTPMTIQLHPQCLLGIQSILRNWTFLIFKQV